MAITTTPVLSAGQQIRLRRDGRMSARRLSAEAGLSPGYVGKVEVGDIEPGLRQFARIARVLEFNAREIYVIVMSEALR